MPSSRHLTLLAIGLIATLGCPSGDTSGPGPAPATVDRVTVSPAAVNLLVGAQQALSATALASNGSPIAGKAAAWSSDNTSAATVNATSGLVTAVGAGTALITAMIDGRTGQATVGVTAPGLVASAASRSFSFTQHGAPAAPQLVAISATVGSIGGLVATINYTTGSGWLGASLNAAVTPATLTVAVVTTALAPGTYAAVVRVSGASGTPVDVAVSVQVAPPPLTLNLSVPLAYLTQAVQRTDHGVELVAGRDALLRVFAVANEPTPAKPRVRAKLWHGSTEVWGTFIGVETPPLQVNEGSLASSWDIVIPGNLVIPGLRFKVDVDPDGIVPETNEADNEYPMSGSPLAVAVRNLPPFRIRFVPVQRYSSGPVGPIGDVTPSNAESYLDDLRRLLPVHTYSLEVRETFYTGVQLDPTNANGSWSTLLNQMLALRQVTDGDFTGYYYGVVRLPYALPGITGMAYVPPNAGSGLKAAVGWDDPNRRAETLAHEVGHNFGRWHAPCGDPANPDPGYPHPGGAIGAWGLDLRSMQIHAPATSYDLMGYCHPDWVSDYTWNSVVTWRASFPFAAPTSSPSGISPPGGLLIWGRITPTGVVLEPAFSTPRGNATVESGGEWQVEALDGNGHWLAGARFTPVPVADLPTGTEHHFAIVLPVDSAVALRISSLRVSGPGGSAEQRARSEPDTGMQGPVLDAPAAGRRRVRWDGMRYPAALIRNPDSGEVIAIAQGGVIELPSTAGALDLELSDGVRVLRRRVSVQ